MSCPFAVCVNDGVTHCIPHANNLNICASVPLKDRENRDRDSEDRAPVSTCLPLSLSKCTQYYGATSVHMPKKGTVYFELIIHCIEILKVSVSDASKVNDLKSAS